ncbi:MAG: DNA oxidative demethylase AlkB [bacterium]|nr:DNA oxidative demethylase AlkB [bacterium]
MNLDLFAGADVPLPDRGEREELAPGAWILRGFSAPRALDFLNAMREIARSAPPRNMTTPGGFRMSVAITNCGRFGWVSDRKGYRYASEDPVSGRPWPALPESWERLAREAAEAAGYPDFKPDACLINRYEVGNRMSLHQDRDERDFEAPIVSVSLGLPAVFQFGGPERSDPVTRCALNHGDVLVFGGPSRLNFHGVAALKSGEHPLTGAYRYNFTFRRAR